MIKFSRIILLILLDIAIINFSFVFAYLLRFEFDVNSEMFQTWFVTYLNNAIPFTLCVILCFALFGIYTSMWRYAGNAEMLKIAMGSLCGMFAVMAYILLTQQNVPRSIYFITGLLITVLVVCSRMLYRYLRSRRMQGMMSLSHAAAAHHSAGAMTRVMVVGAGDAGASMIQEMKAHPEYGRKAVVAIDDDPRKIGNRLMGVKVAGGHDKIRELSVKYEADEIIIAIPSANHKTIQRIVAECNKTKCKVRILPALIDLINEKVSIAKLRNVDIEDLLGRSPVHLNNREISGYLEGRIVLVTGAGGSIGSELCRQITKYKPRRIVALDIYENSVFELAQEMKQHFPNLQFDVVIASVRSSARMREIMEKYKPHVIFHAAAHKHVPLMESNPKEAVLNNIVGTKNLVDLADEFAVMKFVMISTDKAVNPANVMGTTKRVCEMILQNKQRTAINTSYAAVRFGNVLGSNGSVIPIFRNQIAQGGPVTVTDANITRYFMTIPEAVQLVIQTGAMGRGGEIFILDMGEPVRIMELAENVIRLSGYVPYEDIDIQVVGLRPGEKLYEELLLDEEGIEKTAHDKIYIGHPLPANPTLQKMLDDMDGSAFRDTVDEICHGTDEEVRAWLRAIVPNSTI